jgi:hypothetical protein
MSVNVQAAPAPARVDELAQEYFALREKHLQGMLAARALQAELDAKGEELKELIAAHGSARAEKSKLLHGIGFEMMLTCGQQISTDFAAVEKFREAASSDLKPRQFARIFEKVVSYRLLASAAEFVRTTELSTRLKALYAACQVIRERAPTLTVRPKGAPAARG